MSTNRGPNIVSDGLVLYLDAANPYSYVSGSGTWLDLTGNNNTGSLFNGPVFSSENGGSIVFDGSNDIVIIGQFPYTLNNIGTNDVTLNVWSKISVSDANLRYQIGVFPRVGTAFPLGYVNGKMYASFSGYNGTTSNFFVVYGTATTLPLNTWIMTTAVIDRSSDIKLYFNGEIEPISGSANISSVDGVTFNTSTVYPVCIGGSEFRGPLRLHQGSISLAQLYFRALSAAEVKQNYNATKGRFGL